MTKERKRNVRTVQKKEREPNAFLQIGKGTETERVPHFTKKSNAFLKYDNKTLKVCK